MSINNEQVQQFGFQSVHFRNALHTVMQDKAELLRFYAISDAEKEDREAKGVQRECNGSQTKTYLLGNSALIFCHLKPQTNGRTRPSIAQGEYVILKKKSIPQCAQ